MKIKNAFLSIGITLLVIAMLPLISIAQKDYELTSEQGNFYIIFPGEPTYSVEDVETAVGKLKMHSYLFEESNEAAYMVAYIDYPDDLVEESDNDVLLEAALEGALSSWGIDIEEVKKETRWHSGYKGIFCNEKNGDTHAAYEVILAENRLYQLAILQYDKPIPRKSLDTFYDSFELK
ncbi:MAG: hypothetical protein V2I47_00565 [Bacteroidales bacterium]|jgi:hypothetical protein|nr:hypothetical protein [Bacteroidales bacterium]